MVFNSSSLSDIFVAFSTASFISLIKITLSLAKSYSPSESTSYIFPFIFIIVPSTNLLKSIFLIVSLLPKTKGPITSPSSIF